MKLSIDSADINSLTKLATSELVRISDVSFHGGNKISVTGRFTLPKNPDAGLGIKFASWLNKKTPQKTITVSISADKESEKIKVALEKLGLKYFGFTNRVLPLLIDLFGKLLKKTCDINELPEGVEWNGKSMTVEYNSMLRDHGINLRVNELEFKCLGETLRFELQLAKECD